MFHFFINFAIQDADRTTSSREFILSKNYHVQTNNQQSFTRTRGNLLLQDCFMYCCWGVSLIDSLKQNSQLAVSQPSHKWLEVQCQSELQNDSAAHLCQILPSSLTMLSTQLFCIPQLQFRGKKKIKTQKGLKYLVGKYYGHVIAMISVYMWTQSSLVFITFIHFSSKNTSSIKLQLF